MTDTRKVAVFNTNFLPYSQTFVYEQLVNHAQYEPEVFCWRTENSGWFPFEPVHQANFAYGATRFAPAFNRRFETAGFDIVHAHFAPGAVYALPYVERFDLPMVVTFHGYDVPLYWNQRRYHPYFWPFLLHGERVLERMTLGLPVSNELKELLMFHGVPEEKLRVHHLGIDLERFRPKKPGEAEPDPLRICVVGRFVEQKGIEYAIRAFAPHASPHVHLDIIGDGPMANRFHALVARLGIGNFVSFLGVLQPDEVAKHLGSCDVFMAPSVITRNGQREGGLTVAKEASASGLPVVGTIHGGIPEIIEDGVSGFLVQERNVDALSNRLGTLLRDRSLREEMGAAGRTKMEREYDIKKQVVELEGLYDEAIDRFRGAART